ncbi:MAG: sensor histidine kinase, partial [Crocinitomicaceae bacterium]|nr:sensor histidine kinase [Crocinitomicaceae bacterium]
FGIGIPAEEQKNLFERFFRAQNAENIQGTGLGLYIVQRYLRIMGGSIYFESEENNGTTFFVEIKI